MHPHVGDIIGRNWRMTEHGATACRFRNRTGANTIKGTFVCSSRLEARSIKMSSANSIDCCGVVYDDNENAVPDGQMCWVVRHGLADVLLEDCTSVEVGDWLRTCDVPGRAKSSISPPSNLGLPEIYERFQGVGHANESAGPGTNVLCLVDLHLN